MPLDPAVLGVLRQKGPLTGYQIKQAVANSVGDFWSMTFGGLYPALARMVESGILEIVDGEGETKLHRITAKGEREFTEWLLQPVQAINVKNEFLLKLYWASDDEIRQMAGLVSGSLARKAEKLNYLQQIHNDSTRTKGQWFVIKLGIDTLVADIQWLKELLLWILQRDGNEKA